MEEKKKKKNKEEKKKEKKGGLFLKSQGRVGQWKKKKKPTSIFGLV
jgi:hypothetical protein